jgi:hypothetical protein
MAKKTAKKETAPAVESTPAAEPPKPGKSQRVCPKCKAIVASASRACPECGEPRPEGKKISEEFTDLLNYLQGAGWAVRLRSSPLVIPEGMSPRYDWVPSDLREFIGSTETILSPDETSWVITGGVLSGTSGLAYAWNEWELDSLEAANGDLEWQQRIRGFWDLHFPVIMSVKTGYAFIGIRAGDGSIVCGADPEFEETTVVASSLSEFIRNLRTGDPQLSPWI